MTELPTVPYAEVTHPTVASVNLDHLRHNARILQEHAGEAELIAVVKADAYGHGSVPVARALRSAGIRHFAVAIVSEAIALRRGGITDDILVFSAPLRDQLPAYQQFNLQVNVTSPDVARWVADAALAGQPLRVHVKVDTGMHRLGLPAYGAADHINRLITTPGITVEGIWTHLATADAPDTTFAVEQIERFRSVLAAVRGQPRSIHVANSAALLLVPDALRFPARVFVRPGIALYGLMNEDAQIHRFGLRPAMTLRSHVQHLHVVPRGETVSYGRRWRAVEDSLIATIGTGYADGYPRILSNRAEVGIRGRRYPVAGTVCMDMTMLYIHVASNRNASVSVGDEVVLFGEGGPSAAEVARWAETIPYEICCGVTGRVPREWQGVE